MTFHIIHDITIPDGVVVVYTWVVNILFSSNLGWHVVHTFKILWVGSSTTYLTKKLKFHVLIDWFYIAIRHTAQAVSDSYWTLKGFDICTLSKE